MQALSRDESWRDKPSLWIAGTAAVREYGPGIVRWLKAQPSPYDQKRLDQISRLILELFPERGPIYLNWPDPARELEEAAA